MNRALAISLTVASLSSCAATGSDPIVSRSSEAFQSATSEMSPTDIEHFWNWVKSSSSGWLSSERYLAVSSKLRSLDRGPRVEIMYGLLKNPAFVGAMTKLEKRVELAISIVPSPEVFVLELPEEAWNTLVGSIEEYQRLVPCSPNLNVKDGDVLYLRFQGPGQEFELITYGLLPRFPEEATSAAPMAPCTRKLMEIVRQIEGPAIRKTE